MLAVLEKASTARPIKPATRIGIVIMFQAKELQSPRKARSASANGLLYQAVANVHRSTKAFTLLLPCRWQS